MDFRDLDKGFAAIDRHFGIGEAGRNRGGGTGVSQANKHARSQKNFRLARLGSQRLTRVYSDRFLIQGFRGKMHLAFDVIYGSWSPRLVVVGSQRRLEKQQGEGSNCGKICDGFMARSCRTARGSGRYL